MERKIKFDKYEAVQGIYNQKDFVRAWRDFRFLAKNGFFGYQGQFKVSKMSDRALFALFCFIHLTNEEGIMIETGWKQLDNNIAILDNFVETLLKRGFKTIFDEDVVEYYFATADMAKIKKLLKKYSPKKYEIKDAIKRGIQKREGAIQ